MFIINPFVFGVSVPLLNNLSVSPIAAYSLRKLKSSYSGAAIRVKRTADSEQLDIGFLANGSLDIPALSAFATSALTLEKYYDQSGNGKDLTASGAAQAAISVVSGKAVIAGVDTSKWTTATNVPVTAPKIFSIVNPSVVSGNSYLHDFANNGFFVAFFSSTLRMYNDVIFDSTAPTMTGMQQVTAYFQSGNDSARINGADFMSGTNAGDAATNAILTLGNYAGSGQGIVGGIYEWMAFDGAISNTDRDAIEASQISASTLF